MTHPTGTVTTIGADHGGLARIYVTTTREGLERANSLIYRKVAVVPMDAIREYEVVGFDAASKTVELRFIVTPDVAIGDIWSVL